MLEGPLVEILTKKSTCAPTFVGVGGRVGVVLVGGDG